MSRISSKNQITIPVDVLRAADLRAGDDVEVRVAGKGRLEIERPRDWVRKWAGALPPGTYPAGYLESLRDEWER